MRKSRLIFLILISTLLLACSESNEESFIQISESISETSESESIFSETTSDSSSISTSESESESEESTSIEVSESESESEESTSIEVSESESESEEESEQESIYEGIPSSGVTLPNGNIAVDGPTNTTPINIDEYENYDIYYSLPDYFSYIYGNNKIKNCNNFYANTGAFEFSKITFGLQSPLLENYTKIEIRLHISEVHGKQNKFEEDDPLFHIYGYDNKGKFIYNDEFENKDYSEKDEIRIYIENKNVSYFEIRQTNYLFDGKKFYNFGINKITLKGFNY